MSHRGDVARANDTAVYVHFPWCAKRCPYCDFATSAIEVASIPHEAYADAVVRELDERRPSLTGRRLISIFFGGGTPSLWSEQALGRVVRAIRNAFGDADPDVEITAECNPSSFDARKAEGLREAGVNRVSLGMQSLDDEHLRFLGRRHDAAGALAALDEARRIFTRVSGDLMFGMPGQTAEGLRTDLGRLLDRGLTHLSAYALTIEPGTPFGDLHRRGRLPVAEDETYAALFEEAERTCDRLSHYEVSNYAVPGEESRHNLHYWRGGSYLGLGAAAVGCLHEAPGRARRWRNTPDASTYANAASNAREESEEHLDGPMIVREALMLGLRTAEGVDLAATAGRAGLDPLAGRERALERRLGRGDLVREGQRLRVPRERWLQLDGIVADLF